MKYLFTLLLAFIYAAAPASAQGNAPLSPKATASGDNIEVTYGQPAKRGRVIFGQLVPYGQVWRTGANEATEITFKKAGTIAGKPVKAGTYTLFTIPGEKEWTIILNSQLKQWGAFDYDKSKDVLQAKVPAEKLKDVQEKFIISVTSAGLVLAWDQTSVTVPLR